MKSETPRSDDPLGRILGYCVALVAILGISAGLYGYYSGEHSKRVQNTFEFFKEFRTEGVLGKYQALIDRYNEKADFIKNLMVQHRENVQERDRLVLESIQALIAKADGLEEFSAVLLFFDQLAACVENSLCDNNSAVALFNLPAREFASAYGPYIVSIRDRYKNTEYGTGLFKTRALATRWSLF